MTLTLAQYTTHPHYATPRAEKLHSWLHRQWRRLPEAWRHAALVLLHLALDPARSLLEPVYAPGPRGPLRLGLPPARPRPTGFSTGSSTIWKSETEICDRSDSAHYMLSRRSNTKMEYPILATGFLP
jgi:hypothetical protein